MKLFFLQYLQPAQRLLFNLANNEWDISVELAWMSKKYLDSFSCPSRSSIYDVLVVILTIKFDLMPIQISPE